MLATSAIFRPSSPLLLLSSFLLLLLTPSPSSALPHPPLDHTPRGLKHRDLFSELNATLSSVVSTLTSSSSPTSPRPTPEPISGGLAQLVANYKALSIDDLLGFATTTTDACYDSSATASLFNSLFVSGGENTTILLCPGQVINIDETILFTASGQGIQTQGGSAVALTSRAQLVITSSDISTAIQASGVDCNDLLVDSIIIDGGRGTLGALSGGAALLELGGTSQRHTVTNCQLSNTRGWSSLHIIQGTGLTCSDAVIKNNVIGPSGTEASIADGISLACNNSIVQGNEITDATDGGIVIFGSPGSDISGNTITSTSSILLGGINLVDYSPFSGDYTGVQVYDNNITAAGTQIKVGIAMGPSIWGDSTTNVNFGANVRANTFGGTHMSFALAIAGVEDWSVTDNLALSTTRFEGVRGSKCHGLSASVTPTFAIIDTSKSTATLGDDANCWTQGTMSYLICYDAEDTTTQVSPDSAFTGGTCTASAQAAESTTSAWLDSGFCLLDADTRILASDYSLSDVQTVELCTSTCTSLQYTYAGMENSKQCYCGNEINTASGQGGQYNSTTYCTSVCPGDATEICGGNSYLMSLWYDSSRVSAPSLNSTST